MAESLIVALIVAGAFAYSGWALMPAAWQHALRRRIGLAVPAAAAADGCGGCGGCGTGSGRGTGNGHGTGSGRGTGNGCSTGSGYAAPPDTSATGQPLPAVVTLHRRLPASGPAGGHP